MRKKVLAAFGVLLALALTLAGTPHPVAAESPAQGPILNEMKVVRTFGGVPAKDPFGQMGGCMNRRSSYRLMQVLERNQFPDGVLRPYDLTLQAGWIFGCALSFFQTEKYQEGTDQGLWLGWRFAMPPGAADSFKFQFSGRSRSSGERFLCTPIKDIAEGYFPVAVKWNAKLGGRWRKLRKELLLAILKADHPGKKFNELTEEQQEKVFNKLNKQMEAEWPKKLVTDEERALDKESDRLSDLLNRILDHPKVEDYEYRVLEKGVGVEVLVQDGSLKTTGGDLELKGRNRGLTETMLFRLAQIASGLWQDKKFHADDVMVETGWNDPKVKEFLTGGLRVPEGRIVLGAAGSLTAEKDLGLADAWFRVSALSTGKSLLFRATEKMLSPRYFELKGKGASTAQEETRLAGLAQVSPFLGGFEVRDCPKGKGLDDVLYDDSLVFLGQDGSKEKQKLGLLVYELVKDANISSDIIFNTVTGFRAAQFASQAWSDGVFKPADVSVTVGPMLRGTNPADFWKSLGVADVETSAGASDNSNNERLTVRIKIKSTGEIYTIAETEDLGRRDYANLKAYADRIRPLAKKKKGATAKLQTLAKVGRVSAFGEVHVMHDELKGWSGALHITEESMEELIGRATAAPNVGNFVVSKTTVPSTPGNPDPEKPKPEEPKPENPKPETPKPEAPKPETPKPEDPKPGTPKPEDPKPGTPKPEDPKPGPQTEKKDGSGGCDAGLLSFAALALVPMASRFGRKAR